MDLKGSMTEKNLLKTFAGESRARNKYNFYAETAANEGYIFIANIFNETAGNEKAHARRVYDDFLKNNKTTQDNLMDSAMGEAYESEKLYKQFEDTARKEGFTEIADLYKELSEVEENHKNRYLTILKNLKSGKIFKKDVLVKWQCMNCGYIHEGMEAPKVCPLCKYPQSYFELYCENYK